MVSLYVHEFSTLTKFVVYQSSTNSSSVKDKLLKNSEPFFFFFLTNALSVKEKLEPTKKEKRKRPKNKTKYCLHPKQSSNVPRSNKYTQRWCQTKIRTHPKEQTSQVRSPMHLKMLKHDTY